MSRGEAVASTERKQDSVVWFCIATKAKERRPYALGEARTGQGSAKAACEPLTRPRRQPRSAAIGLAGSQAPCRCVSPVRCARALSSRPCCSPSGYLTFALSARLSRAVIGPRYHLVHT